MSTERWERSDGDTNLLETTLGTGMSASSRKDRTSDETRVVEADEEEEARQRICHGVEVS